MGESSDILCTQCDILVPKIDYRHHCKEDLHIYNIKRNISGLEPIAQKEFSEIYKKFNEPPAQKTQEILYCAVCKKNFKTKKSHENHLSSIKHLAVESRETQDHNSSHENVSENAIMEIDVVEEENIDVLMKLPDNSCIFCPEIFQTANATLTHMKRTHGFQIPHENHLIDKEGFLNELLRIVGEERSCIHCGRQFFGSKPRLNGEIKSISYQSKCSLSALRQHMLTKAGHMELWIGPYNPDEIALTKAIALEAFEASKSSQDDYFNPPACAKAGGELFHQFYDGTCVIPDFRAPDSSEDAYQMVLPSGAVIGHRQYNHIYKQRLNLDSALVLSRKRSDLVRLITPVNLNRASHAIAIANKAAYDGHFTRSDINKQKYAHEHDKSEQLSLGLRSNLVSRGHLRRQY